MAQITYRSNLSSAYFPYLSTLHGRSVIVGGNDHNFSRQLQSSSDLDKDIGIPQVYYCQNVLPTEQGFKAIGYEQRIASSGFDDALQQHILRNDATGQKAYIVKTETGFRVATKESVGYTGFENTYSKLPGPTLANFPALTSRQITTAHVSGVSYLCIEGIDVVKLNFSTKKFEQVVLTGVSVSDIIGITESNGYLIVYSRNSVAWSSLITPTDFVPSLETGAGGGNVEGARGNITTAVPTSDGFILYTENNAVSVLYTNNAVYPFQFSECLGAGGLTSQESVSFESTEGYNYAYTSKGLQIIKRRTAETIMPALTDFLSGKTFEYYNYSLDTVIPQDLTTAMVKKLTVVASRYFILSYGLVSLTHCVVYDLVQKRVGKLKIDHVDCFEYENTDVKKGDIPKSSIAFLTKSAQVLTVNFKPTRQDCIDSQAVIILGKYQYIRNRYIQLEKVDLENVEGNSSFDCRCLTSWEGKEVNANTAGVSFNKLGKLSTYGFGSPVGVNHSLVVKGNFDLNSVLLFMSVNGSTS
jgi:hypothetical protein